MLNRLIERVRRIPLPTREAAFRYGRMILGEYGSRRGPLLAQGIAFSLLVGLVPLLLLLASAGSMLYDVVPHVQQSINTTVRELLPRQISSPLLKQLHSLSRSWAGLGGVGIILLVFMSREVFKSMGAGLSAMMGGAYRRPFWKSELTSVLLTFFTIVLLVASAAGEMAIGNALKIIPLRILRQIIYPLLMKSLSVIVLAAALMVLYYVFSRVRRDRRFAWRVSLAVSILWHLIGMLGNVVVMLFARRVVLYGVFAGAVLFLLWLAIFAHLLLLGGLVIANRDMVLGMREAGPGETPQGPRSSGACSASPTGPGASPPDRSVPHSCLWIQR